MNQLNSTGMSADETAARKAAADFARKYPTVMRDTTVTLTPIGWVAYDHVARKRLYPR